MNLKEGTRRLALLLGAGGVIICGFASYAKLQTDLNQRARHNKFEQLSAGDLVRQERKCRLAGIMSGCSANPYAAIALPAQESSPGVRFDPQTGERIQIDPQTGERMANPVTEWDASGKPIGSPSGSAGLASAGGSKQKQEHDPWDKYAEQHPPSEVNKDGIHIIHWNKAYGAESIELEDGTTLYPTPAPTAWPYILAALLPILGFFVPWSATRAIGWVGTGFFQPPK